MVGGDVRRKPVQVWYLWEADLGLRSGGEARARMFPRITVDPAKMGGVPCVRGLRIPVATIVGMVAEGMTEQQILAAYPSLELDDIRESLRYAAEDFRE